MTTQVDDFIIEMVLPQYRPIVRAFRELVANIAPQLKEGMRGGTEAYYAVPVYRLKHDIIVISPSKKGITFAFSKGAQFEDRFGKLTGAGKTNKNVVIRALEDFNDEAMTDYIQQAIDLDRN